MGDWGKYEPSFEYHLKSSVLQSKPFLLHLYINQPNNKNTYWLGELLHRQAHNKLHYRQNILGTSFHTTRLYF